MILHVLFMKYKVRTAIIVISIVFCGVGLDFNDSNYPIFLMRYHFLITSTIVLI